MRRRAHRDDNHLPIQRRLEEVTIVEDTSHVGEGFPDMIARHRLGYPVFIEIKNPKGNPKKRELRKNQATFAQRWGGAYVVVLTEDEALRAVGR